MFKKIILHVFPALQPFFADIEKYKKLKKVTAKDCHGQLLSELIFQPKNLRRRYQNEIVYQTDISSRWK